MAPKVDTLIMHINADTKMNYTATLMIEPTYYTDWIRNLRTYHKFLKEEINGSQILGKKFPVYNFRASIGLNHSLK